MRIYRMALMRRDEMNRVKVGDAWRWMDRGNILVVWLLCVVSQLKVVMTFFVIRTDLSREAGVDGSRGLS